MLRCSTTVALAFALLCGFSQAEPINLVANGGFETGNLTPWFIDLNLGGLEPWIVTTTSALDGTYGAEDNGNISLRQNFAPTKAADISLVGVTLEYPEFIGANAYDFFYTNGTHAEFVINGGVDHLPHTYDLTSNLDRSLTLNGFSIFGFGFGPTAFTYLDDVKILTNVPEPVSMVLFAGFAVMLYGTRRRAD
jgi:hypothetical protein